MIAYLSKEDKNMRFYQRKNVDMHERASARFTIFAAEGWEKMTYEIYMAQENAVIPSGIAE